MLNRSIHFECVIHDSELEPEFVMSRLDAVTRTNAYVQHGIQRVCCEGEPLELVNIGYADGALSIYSQGQYVPLKRDVPLHVDSIRVIPIRAVQP